MFLTSASLGADGVLSAHTRWVWWQAGRLEASFAIQGLTQPLLGFRADGDWRARRETNGCRGMAGSIYRCFWPPALQNSANRESLMEVSRRR